MKKRVPVPQADVVITNSTFNGSPHGVKLDEQTAAAVNALAAAAEANAHAITAIATLAKGGDSYGLYLAGDRGSDK